MSELRTDEQGWMVDPRECPNVFPDGYQEWAADEKQGIGHDWSNQRSRCRYCDITEDQVRDLFRDWRWEMVTNEMCSILDRLIFFLQPPDDPRFDYTDRLENT